MVRIRVDGDPVGQGNHSRNRYGATYEATKGHADWRARIQWAARQQRCGFIDGPVELVMLFERKRPKRHYLASGGVNPRYEDAMPTTKPDIDKLERSVLDALTGIAYRDDSQVCRTVSEKAYGDPGLTLWVRPYEGRMNA